MKDVVRTKATCRQKAACLAAIGLLLGTVAGATPPLNGNYGSHGSGTWDGGPESEISVWSFRNNSLVTMSEQVILGQSAVTMVTSCQLSANQNGAPLPLQILTPGGGLNPPGSPGANMLAFGCLGPSADMAVEHITIIPENGGQEFEYSIWGSSAIDPAGRTSSGYEIQISGHGVHK